MGKRINENPNSKKWILDDLLDQFKESKNSNKISLSGLKAGQAIMNFLLFQKNVLNFKTKMYIILIFKTMIVLIGTNVFHVFQNTFCFLVSHANTFLKIEILSNLEFETIQMNDLEVLGIIVMTVKFLVCFIETTILL
ncbi:hypothetical protein [Leptospira alexanderi]|uniref:hypothetical protein n=1 Tax=Leptospira alexanderi TaxID=100053 RepID=UPI000990BA1A|nr:hypothetical protein [Leptospira alexanderi]